MCTLQNIYNSMHRCDVTCNISNSNAGLLSFFLSFHPSIPVRSKEDSINPRHVEVAPWLFTEQSGESVLDTRSTYGWLTVLTCFWPTANVQEPHAEALWTQAQSWESQPRQSITKAFARLPWQARHRSSLLCCLCWLRCHKSHQP